MKEGWELKKLGDVCEKTINIKWDKDSENKYQYIDLSSVCRNKLVILESTEITGKTAPSRAKKIIETNDVIFATTRPTLKRSTIILEEYNHQICSTGYVVLRAKREYVESKYIFYFLQTDEFIQIMESTQKGASYPAVSDREVKSILLNLPTSLDEQKQIVAILDKAFEAMDRAKENIEKNLLNAKELFQSKLGEIFSQKGEGWEEKKLQEVCEKISDGTHQTPKYFDDGIIFLSSRNVTSGKIDWDNIKYIDNEQHLVMHKHISPRVNDILLAKNGTTGVAAMVDRDVVFDIYVSLAHIRVLDMVLPHFMLYFINSPIAKKQFNKRLKGSGVPNLHLKEIREVVIFFPSSLDKQKEIITMLNNFSDTTKKAEYIYQQKLSNLEDLKKTILQKAFNGELV